MKELLRVQGRMPAGVPDDKRLKPYKRLASSVMELAFTDAEKQASSTDNCGEARRFLCGNSQLLHLWCRWLNIHPDRIRAAAQNRGWSKGVGRSVEDRA
jgi:hypothetical protein